MRIAAAFDDPGSIRKLVEDNGPYPSVATYLPPSASGGAAAKTNDAATTLPWFRGNWAVNGRAVVAGADSILCNSSFIDAAVALFGAEVTPTTVVVNVNAPMSAGAVHVDIPSFRGANRDHYPLRLLQAMGTSGLFERWRVVEAGAICWFYEGPGGAYEYWPDGLDGQMCSERPPFDNVALVADNDRMYHRIGWIGEQAASAPAFAVSAEIDHIDGGGWAISDTGQQLAHYSDAEIRISVLWKGRVAQGAEVDRSADVLTPDLVAKLFAADLDIRGVEHSVSATLLSDDTWIDRLHAIYYPVVLPTT